MSKFLETIAIFDRLSSTRTRIVQSGVRFPLDFKSGKMSRELDVSIATDVMRKLVDSDRDTAREIFYATRKTRTTREISEDLGYVDYEKHLLSLRIQDWSARSPGDVRTYDRSF